MAGTSGEVTRYALIGARRAAEYAVALPQVPEARITAVAEADADARAGAAELLGAEHQASSVDDLLDGHGDAVDAVLVHDAAQARANSAETAVRAGKHVLAAMPAASTTAAADELAAAASAGGVALMLGESLRFLPSQQVIKQRLDEGKLGAIGLLRAHRWLPGAGDGAPESAIITAVPYLDLANVWHPADPCLCPWAGQRVRAGTPGLPRRRNGRHRCGRGAARR